jgi:hypothetical protein
MVFALQVRTAIPVGSGSGGREQVALNPPRESGHMENLRWWLLVIAAVMISMSR